MNKRELFYQRLISYGLGVIFFFYGIIEGRFINWSMKNI